MTFGCNTDEVEWTSGPPIGVESTGDVPMRTS